MTYTMTSPMPDHAAALAAIQRVRHLLTALEHHGTTNRSVDIRALARDLHRALDGETANINRTVPDARL